MVIVSVLVIFIYALLIINFLRGWIALPEFEASGMANEPRVTIITACKNEVNNLQYLFQAVNEQSFRNFEFLLVDDGSTDGSYEYAEQVSLNFPELKLLRNSGKGKKEAIKTAVLQSESEIIVTLDADCLPSVDWLNEIVQFYISYPSDLIICPVKMDSDGSFFQEFQQFEFASLIASGAGAAGMDMPILCNGANLAFRRESWLECMDNLHFEVPGGDDIFLLQSIKKRKGIIRFLKSVNATVTTHSAVNLKSFIHQRRRWASKKSAYTDWQLALTAAVVFLASFIVLLDFVLAIVQPNLIALVLNIFLLKLLIDVSFFYKISDFFGLKKVLLNTFVFSLIYPFYIVFTAILSLAGSKKTW